jgi:iron(III) transport system ATP-binding protein
VGTGYDIDIANLRKYYIRRNGTPVRAIDDISLSIGGGEFIVLLGPSGCGKTTLLRCLAGLETPDAGKITVGGRVVFDASSSMLVPPEHRRIGMMFQSYALWPHMTVYENIRFPLRMQAVDKATAAQKISRVLEMMHIADLMQQYPNQLSGGQQQRVALARAMVCSDNLILFDEPLSNVDAKVREHLRTELGVMQKHLGFTAIYVTHDQDEAMALADRIVVLDGGRISQCGAPHDVYSNPRDVQVADFVGSANFFDGEISRGDGLCTVETPLGSIQVPEERIRSRQATATVMSRPERWKVNVDPAQAGQCWQGTVRLITHLGPHTDYIIAINGRDIRIRDYNAQSLAIGDSVWCSIDPGAFLVLDPRE